MTVIDFRKDPTYKAKSIPSVVDVPDMLFVMVDGKGAPETSGRGATEFQTAMEILFGIVYAVKFWDKKHATPAGYAKFSMAPVEGLWWTRSGREFELSEPEDWCWTALLRVPEFVSPDYFQDVVCELVDKKRTDIYKLARLEHIHEGPCVQIPHTGPYDQEKADIDTLHTFAKDKGYVLTGKHHELYFGDPRRTRRQPIRKA
jgi:hypothetical protein